MDTVSTLHPNYQKLVDRAQAFIAEIEDLTPGRELEAKLNRDYGPGTPYYDDFSRLIRQALDNNEGWVSREGIDGSKFRLTDISSPSEATRYFSIGTVSLESDVHDELSHTHPYGEINCIIQLDPSAEFMGFSEWQGAGWTSPGPGTGHSPEVRGGALIALFFLTSRPDIFQRSPARSCLMGNWNWNRNQTSEP